MMIMQNKAIIRAKNAISQFIDDQQDNPIVEWIHAEAVTQEQITASDIQGFRNPATTTITVSIKLVKYGSIKILVSETPFVLQPDQSHRHNLHVQITAESIDPDSPIFDFKQMQADNQLAHFKFDLSSLKLALLTY